MAHRRYIIDRLLILLITLAAVIGLSGCGKSADSSAEKSAPTAAGTTTTAAVKTTEADTETTPAPETEAVTETSAAETTTEETSAAETETTSFSETEPESAEAVIDTGSSQEYVEYRFRSKKLLNQHYEKHGRDMGFANAKEYEEAACDVINSPDALYKLEAEDGDGVYYIEETNEFAILSTDGYIRTYFNPNGGRAYFDRQ